MPSAPPTATTATFRAILPKRKIDRSKSTVNATDKAINYVIDAWNVAKRADK